MFIIPMNVMLGAKVSDAIRAAEKKARLPARGMKRKSSLSLEKKLMKNTVAITLFWLSVTASLAGQTPIQSNSAVRTIGDLRISCGRDQQGDSLLDDLWRRLSRAL